jgi:hypothetical protein
LPYLPTTLVTVPSCFDPADYLDQKPRPLSCASGSGVSRHSL